MNRLPIVLPIVGVMGSGTDAHAERSEPLGKWLAGQGVHLLTGGGGGVMAAVSRAFAETPGRQGLVIGILPSGESGIELRAGYPNRWVEVPIRTHLPRTGDEGGDPMSRNHINVLSSDVLVVLPGSAGTASEARLGVDYGRPVIAFAASRHEIAGLPDRVECSDSFDRVCRFVSGVLRTR